jgi:hypothetical protein
MKGVASHEQIGQTRNLVQAMAAELGREAWRSRADDVIRLMNVFMEVLPRTSASSVSRQEYMQVGVAHSP